MKATLLKALIVPFVSTFLLIGVIGCGATPDDTSHAHGPDTHTHDDPVALADTAGTYADTTAIELDHEHGQDTHTHDDDAPAHQ